MTGFSHARAFQMPPDKSFVSLSNAVSWIAFQHSIDAVDLAAELGLCRERTPAQAEADLIADGAVARAVEQLTDLGSGGAITIWGRFFRDVSDDEYQIFTEAIPCPRLADYRWFDPLDNSLHRGTGLAWTGSWRQPYYPFGHDSHYRFVTVNRVDLMREFPPDTTRPELDGKHSKAALPPLSETELQGWWAGLVDEREAISQVALLKLARKRFPGNTITRERLRMLATGRKRGPKQRLGGKATA